LTPISAVGSWRRSSSSQLYWVGRTTLLITRILIDTGNRKRVVAYFYVYVLHNSWCVLEKWTSLNYCTQYQRSNLVNCIFLLNSQNLEGKNADYRLLAGVEFAGTSTNLASGEGWHSVLGFDEEVIDGLWKKYGVFCIHGCSPLEPLCWMWLFSSLKSVTSWMFL